MSRGTDGRLQVAKDITKAVTYCACITDGCEVGLRSLPFAPFRLEEVARLAQVVVIQGCLEGDMCSCGQEILFFQDEEDTHGLLGKRTEQH